jgi:hypothetical protein
MSTRRKILVALAALAAMIAPLAASAAPPSVEPGAPALLATLAGGAASGSAIGPGGALYVPQPAAGQIWRVDPKTGAETLFASGLPQRFPGLPFGGVMDVAFYGSTAYALVSVVGSSFPAKLFECDPGTIGIYRIDGASSSSLVADIGTFAHANPPPSGLGIANVVKCGVQYALEPYRGGFLVTDGHHNRVYSVGLDGTVSQLIQFGDLVPTGLAVRGNTIYMAEAGPVPHQPQNGKIVSFEPGSSSAATVASGARLAVDVEMGRGQTLFALSQGHWTCSNPNETDCPGDAGSPAQPNSGALLRVNADGTMTPVASGLDRPTSLEIIDNTAYVVTLSGEIWRIADIAGPPYGH